MGTISRYVSDEIRPRLGRILFHKSFLSSLVIGIVYFFGGEHVSGTTIKVKDIAGTFLAYGAIALGFCVAGFALVVAFPNEGFAKLLANHNKRKALNSYSNLLFVFSWTGMLHWLLILFSIAVLSVFPETITDLKFGTLNLKTILCSFTVSLVVYCLLQFLLLILTLHQVGAVYIKHLHENK